MAFACPICGATFSRKDNLKKHISDFHKAKTQSTQTPVSWNSRLTGAVLESGEQLNNLHILEIEYVYHLIILVLE